MIYKKVTLLFFLFINIFFNVLTASAQLPTITGNVINKEKLPVELANVILLKNDSVYIGGVETDSLGIFSITAERGIYTLSIYQYGQEYFNKKVEITNNINLKNIEVDDSMTLDPIEIITLRSITHESVDKTTVEVKGQKIFEGDNTVSILNKIQGISIINDRILYDGMEIISLRINNRKINFNSQKEMMEYLKNFDNKSIKNLELINPNAKFSASSLGKTLNIIVDKPVVDGIKFNPKYELSQGRYTDKNFSFFSQLKKDKISSNLFLSYGKNINFINQETLINYSQINESQNQQNVLLSVVKPFNLNIDLQYDHNEKTYLGASFMYNSIKLHDKNQSNINILKSGLQDSILNNYNDLNIHGQYYTTSFYINKKIDTSGQNIRMEMNYNIYNSINKQFLTTEVNGFLKNKFHQNINRKVYLPNIGIDYDNKIFKDINLSIGLHYYYMKNDELRNNIDFEIDTFKYNENVFAQYLSVLGKTKHFSYQMGLRGEATSNSLENYYDIFPSISLRKNYNSLNIQLSYNRSITRPAGFMLSPNIIYDNIYKAKIGDPNLKPTMTNLINSVISFKSWRLSLSHYNYTNSINVLEKISEYNPRLIIEHFINVDRRTESELSISYNYRKENILIIPSFNYTLGNFNINKESEKVKNNFSYFGLSTSYSINKNNRIDGNFRYFFQNSQLYNRTKAKQSFDVTYNKSFLSNSINIQIFAKDLFKTNVDRSRNTLSTFESISEKYSDSRQVGLSIRYSLNSGENIKLDGIRKNVNRK